MSDDPPDDYFDDDGPDDDEDDFDADCGMGPDGYCQNSGTEWCDWECPHSRAADRIAAMKRTLNPKEPKNG